MKRRSFIGTTLAGAATVLARRVEGVGAATVVEKTSTGLKKVPLGKSGVEVTPLGFGTGMKGYQRRSNQTRLGEANFRDVLRHAYDKGIRYFDLADLYGTHPDPVPALKGIDRGEYVLVSKIWWREGGLPELERLDADVLVDRFLSEIQTDYIDLVHLHAVTDADWPEKLAKQMDLLDKLKENGKIRAHGVSVHALPALEVAAEHPWVDAVHTRINPHGVKMDDTPEKVVPVLQKMHANGKGITGMKLVGEGEFASDREKRQNSIRWVYGLGCVDTGIIGFEKTEEVDEAVALVTQIFEEGAVP